MKERVAKIEARFEELDHRFESIDQRLSRIEDKMLTKWDIAQVVGSIIGIASLLVLLGPRLIAMMS